ncbi:Hypothetical predicted protein [Prunus dulcis]|uniref:Uncharacterized protein n=1 Tax=Prunus dulcis TaxID=3755 RepID=A0A5E4G647_PRUDU|nr:Hypothetical predicted protein [Prunus dulcis]
MVGPVINQDASDRTRGTTDHVTYVKFEALSMQVEEVRHFLVGLGNQFCQPVVEPNRKACNPHPVIESEEESEEEFCVLAGDFSYFVGRGEA